MHLCRGLRPYPNECPIYDTKISDWKVPVILDPWKMRSASSLKSLLGPHRLGVLAPVPIYSSNMNKLLTYYKLSKIELFMTLKLGTKAKLNCMK